MKKTIFLIVLTMAVYAVHAQSFRKTEKINSDQVPLVVREAFETDFGKIPKDGYWTASFIVENNGSRSVAKPLSYTYHKRSKSERVEVRYTPEGKLEFVKGLEKTNNNT